MSTDILTCLSYFIIAKTGVNQEDEGEEAIQSVSKGKRERARDTHRESDRETHTHTQGERGSSVRK